MNQKYVCWFGRITEPIAYGLGTTAIGTGAYSYLLSQYSKNESEIVGITIGLAGIVLGSAIIFGGTQIRKGWKILEEIGNR